MEKSTRKRFKRVFIILDAAYSKEKMTKKKKLSQEILS